VDVGALVISNAQTTKLIEPSKCTLYDPPPPAQAAPARRTPHRQEGHDVTVPETLPNRSRVIATIAQHTVRPPPRAAPSAVQRGNRIHQRQGLLRVVPVRAGEPDGEGHSTPVADQMTLAPAP
jgi:hypothetical protein